MLRRHVERFEVVIVVFDLRAFEDLITETREDRADFVTDQTDRMAKSQRRREAGERHVDRIRRSSGCGELRLSLGERAPRRGS